MITFLFHDELLITSSAVASKDLTCALSPTTAVIFLTYPLKDYLTDVYQSSFLQVSVTYRVIIQVIYKSIYWLSLIKSKNTICYKKTLQLQHACYFDPKATKKFDELITTGMLAAKRKCHIFYHLPWDKETHEVMMSKNIIKTLFMGMH